MREIRHIGDFWQPNFAAVAVAPRATVAAPASTGHAARGWRERAQALRARITAEWLVALLASMLSVAAYTYYANRGLTLAYNDAISHMMIARRVVAGRTPGLAQLGTTWLPFNHALMLPLVWIDALYRTGFAGTLPSMAGYVIAAVYLYRLGKLAFTSAAGWVAAFVFMLNPNVLYMQSTPMSELVLLGLAVIAIYYTTRWAHTFQAADLVKASGAAFAGTLVRYDGWALALALAGIVLYIAWRKRGRPFAESNLVLFGTLAFAGCAGWLLYNQIIFGDALEFFDGASSAQAHQAQIAADGGLATKHNPVLSFHVYAQSVIDNNWLPLIVAALVGLVIWAAHERIALHTLPLYALLVPFGFNWLSLVAGISALNTPEIPIQGQTTYFNVRYGLMMIPAVAMFFAYLAYRNRLFITAGLALLMVFAVAGTFIAIPYSLASPLKGADDSPWHLPAGTFLHEHYHGGNILISYSSLAPTVFYANEPDDDFITDSNGAQFKDAIEHPEQRVAWVVMVKDSPSDLIWATLSTRQDWLQYYVLRTTFGNIQIYQRIDAFSEPPAGILTLTRTPTSGSPITPVIGSTADPATTPAPRPTPTATRVPAATPTHVPRTTPTPSPTPTP